MWRWEKNSLVIKKMVSLQEKRTVLFILFFFQKEEVLVLDN